MFPFSHIKWLQIRKIFILNFMCYEYFLGNCGAWHKRCCKQIGRPISSRLGEMEVFIPLLKSSQCKFQIKVSTNMWLVDLTSCFHYLIVVQELVPKKLKIDIINGIIPMVSQRKPKFLHLLGLESLSKVLATLTLVFK
jgi:hypothetical protein